MVESSFAETFVLEGVIMKELEIMAAISSTLRASKK
jgi:hypothetical protein